MRPRIVASSETPPVRRPAVGQGAKAVPGWAGWTPANQQTGSLRSFGPSPSASVARRVAGAFTLLEVMIAIAIFAGVMAAIYASWSGIIRGSKAALEATADAQRARVAIRTLEEALTSAVLFSQNVRHYAFVADTGGSFATLSFVARLGASFPGSGLFGEQTVRRVTFEVKNGQSGPNELVLSQKPLLAPPDSDADTYPLTLARNVKRFSVNFWEPRRGEWIDEWKWTNQLPRAVRIELTFGEPTQLGRQAENVFTRTVALPSLAVPPAYQLGAPAPVAPVPGQPGQPGQLQGGQAPVDQNAPPPPPDPRLQLQRPPDNVVPFR